MKVKTLKGDPENLLLSLCITFPRPAHPIIVIQHSLQTSRQGSAGVQVIVTFTG